MRVKIHTTQGEIIFKEADWYLNELCENESHIIVHHEDDRDHIIANFNFNNPNVLGVSTEG